MAKVNNDTESSKSGKTFLEGGTITFDHFVRGLLIALGVVGAYYLFNALSGVLLPFFIAWLLAYLIYPLVVFLEQKCHLRYRLVSIFITVLALSGIIAALLVLTLPPALRQIGSLSDDLLQYATTYLAGTAIPEQIAILVKDFDSNSVIRLLQNEKVVDAVQVTLHQSWNLVSGTVSVVWGIVGLMMMFLYLIFILLDYENVNKNWILIVPKKYRKSAICLANDIKREMNAYFRGQATVAFLVGVLFSIGFIIIDLPLAIGFGMFIGLLNMVPYAQGIGFIPTVFLALLKSNDTGQSFWLIVVMAIIVFFVVQAIQDLFLVPKIMGKSMGLKPAIILLSLSVWGALLGAVGLIIALPLTTLSWTYYRRFILKEDIPE